MTDADGESIPFKVKVPEEKGSEDGKSIGLSRILRRFGVCEQS